MALDSWLKLRGGVFSARRTTSGGAAIPDSKKIKILAFEAASLMSRLFQIWRLLSDSQLAKLRRELWALASAGICVSSDGNFLLALARAELANMLRLAGDSISLLAGKCVDPSLRRFGLSFREFADSGHDPDRWAMSLREMEAMVKKIDSYLSATANLFEEMENLREGEQALKKLAEGDNGAKMTTISKLQRDLSGKKQKIKRLKKISLWSFTHDAAASHLARLSFTTLCTLKEAFRRESGDSFRSSTDPFSALSCIRCFSSAVHPSSSAPLDETEKQQFPGFFDANAAILCPPPSTLGAACLAFHYAVIIIRIEKLFWAPHLIRDGEREELYSMLPERVRKTLRSRWRELRRRSADEWRARLTRILDFLSPLARQTFRWQDEQSFRQRQRYSALPVKSPALLPQTLFFTDRVKMEEAIVELFVGLAFIWRFAMEMETAPPNRSSNSPSM